MKSPCPINTKQIFKSRCWSNPVIPLKLLNILLLKSDPSIVSVIDHIQIHQSYPIIHVYIYTYLSISLYIYIYTHTDTGWWCVLTILKNDGVRQWEGWRPIYEMENKTCLKPPTRDIYIINNIYICIYIYIYPIFSWQFSRLLRVRWQWRDHRGHLAVKSQKIKGAGKPWWFHHLVVIDTLW